MAFFDNLFSDIGVPGASVISAGLNLAGNALGGLFASDGQEKAADIAGQTALRQEAELREAKKRGIAAIDQGTSDYASTIAPLLTERPIMLPTFQGLTAQQQIGHEDLLRDGRATLAASGLRGAGRAGVGAVMDQSRRYLAAAHGQNDAASLAARAAARGGADSARAGLAGVKANAGTAKANTELGVGSSLAGIYGQAGNTQANIANQTGNTLANLATSTGRLAGNTLMSGVGYEQGNSPNQPVMAPTWGYQPKEDDNRPKV